MKPRLCRGFVLSLQFFTQKTFLKFGGICRDLVLRFMENDKPRKSLLLDIDDTPYWELDDSIDTRAIIKQIVLWQTSSPLPMLLLNLRQL
jgi:hypothetical protein